jgi:hypothetical protein
MSGDHNQYQKGSVSQQPEQEWKYNPMTGEPLIDGWPLYSGLPQQEWQGLTEDDAISLLPIADYEYEIDIEIILQFAKNIEAKLRSKNES